MGDLNNENSRKKRIRDDPDLGSPDEKQVHSERSEPSSPEAKRVRVVSNLKSPESGIVDPAESALNSAEANRIRHNILDILDEPDTQTDRDPPIQDLDSVIKSFEEEIRHSLRQQQLMDPADSSECGESQPDLGYLLEASDDELGLPPSISSSDDSAKNEAFDFTIVAPEAVGLSEILALEDDMPSYDSFGFGIGEEIQGYSNEFVTVGGLFDYDEDSDFSEFLWRPESDSLHAL